MKTKLYYVVHFNMSEMGGDFLESDGSKEIRVYSLSYDRLEQTVSFTISVSQVTEDEINIWIEEQGQDVNDYELEQL